MLAILGFSLRTPFLPFYLQDLGADSDSAAALWSGLINAGGAGVMAITAPFWGAIADRHGRRPMLIRAMFASTITVGLMGFATAPWQLLGLRFMEGAFSGTVTAATALVAVSMPKDRLGYGLGIIQMAVFSGASLGPLFGGVLADQIGYRATFMVAAGMLFVGGLIVTFVVREQFTPMPRKMGGARGFSALRAANAWMFAGVMGSMILMLFASRFASSSVQPIIPLFIEQLGDANSLFNLSAATVSGLALGMLGLTSAISSIFLGRIGDKRGHQPVLLWCALGAGLLYLPMALANASWQLVVLQGLFGVAAAGSCRRRTRSLRINRRRSSAARSTAWSRRRRRSADSSVHWWGRASPPRSASAPHFFVTGVFLLIVTAMVWKAFQRQGTSSPTAETGIAS